MVKRKLPINDDMDWEPENPSDQFESHAKMAHFDSENLSDDSDAELLVKKNAASQKKASKPSSKTRKRAKKNLIVEKKVEEIWKTRKYWNACRKCDFCLVFDIPAKSLNAILDKIRLADIRATMASGIVQNEEEYQQKFDTEDPDTYQSMLQEKGLPWQVILQTNEDWSEADIEYLASEHDIDPLQAEAYLCWKRKGAPELDSLKRKPQQSKKVLTAVQKIYKHKKDWSAEDRELFCNEHGVDRQWLSSYLYGLRSAEKKQKSSANQVQEVRNPSGSPSAWDLDDMRGEERLVERYETDHQNSLEPTTSLEQPIAVQREESFRPKDKEEEDRDVYSEGTLSWRWSDILKIRRRLPSHLTLSDNKKQEALELSFSLCKTVQPMLMSSIQASTKLSEDEIREWFQNRRAYDFEEDARASYELQSHQNLLKAWLYFGNQLFGINRNLIIKAIATWAEVSIAEATTVINKFKERMPMIEYLGVSLPLRDILENIDMLITEYPKRLTLANDGHLDLEKLFIWEFFGKGVNPLKTESRWFQMREAYGSTRKFIDKHPDAPEKEKKLHKTLHIIEDQIDVPHLQLIAKWAEASLEEVTNFYTKHIVNAIKLEPIEQEDIKNEMEW